MFMTNILVQSQLCEIEDDDYEVKADTQAHGNLRTVDAAFKRAFKKVGDDRFIPVIIQYTIAGTIALISLRRGRSLLISSGSYTKLGRLHQLGKVVAAGLAITTFGYEAVRRQRESINSMSLDELREALLKEQPSAS